MEAWDDGQRVRPIPIEDDELVEHVEPEKGRREKTRRPWLPLAIAASAVVIVMASVGVFGALQFDDPEPPAQDAFSPSDTDEEGSTTTATTLPPRLDEAIPDLNDRLTLIAENDEGVWTLLWDPSFRVPKAVLLDVEPHVTDENNVAAFDRGGRFVAIQTCLPTACSVYIGLPAEPGTHPDLIGVGTWTWHGSEVGRIAWTEYREDNHSAVMTASVNPLSNGLDDVTEMFKIPGNVVLSHWDGTGFILRNDATTAYSESGEVQWSIDGVFPTSATTSIVSIVDPGFTWAVVDRMTGEHRSDIEISGSSQDSSAWLTTSESTDLVAKVADGVNGSKLTVEAGSLNAPRLVSIKPGFRPLRFTENSQYFVFANESGTTLSFVDWRTGATYEVNAPAEYRIVGFYLG